MVHQLLWIEAIIKFSGGVVLLLIPISAARAVGLPHGNIGLWPRIAGALLIGIAGAIYLEGLHLTQFKHGGLGLAGVAVINITAIFAIATFLVLNLIKTIRGRLIMWSLVTLLMVLVVFEVAAS